MIVDIEKQREREKKKRYINNVDEKCSNLIIEINIEKAILIRKTTTKYNNNNNK